MPVHNPSPGRQPPKTMFSYDLPHQHTLELRMHRHLAQKSCQDRGLYGRAEPFLAACSAAVLIP